MKKYRILLVIPAYNEEANILNVYNKVLEHNKRFKTNYDVIVINDGSKDNTEDVCIKNNIPYISLICNLVIGGAVQTGYKYAIDNNYDIAIQFDGDGQHDIRYVKDLIKPIIEKDVDMVIGSRFIDDGSSNFKSSKIRRIGINIISFFINIITKKKIYDTTSGFRAINKRLIEEFCNSYPVEYPEPVSIVNVLQKGYLIKEVPVSMNERKNGVSSIKTWKNVYYMINVILSILVVGMGGGKK